MNAIGIEGMTEEQITREIQRGGTFRLYHFCISVLVVSFKRSSKVHFVKAGHSPILPGLRFTLLSLLFGCWGIPWGPIWTIQAIITNFQGGKDVTQAFINSIVLRPSAPATPGHLPD